jgi:predicted AAA+ superfamily ATPase
MMNIEKIKEIIATWLDEIQHTVIFERNIYPLVKEQFLKPFPLVLHGIRRSGKTFLMYRLLQDFPGGAYINFEDERFTGAGSEVLDEIYNTYIGSSSAERPVLLLDEVQNIKGWEKFVSRLQSKVKFVISGSNATLLSSEYSTALTGRHIPLRIFPLSFSEFLIAKEQTQLNPLISEQRAKLRILLSEYLDFGGFPQASLLKDKYLLKATFDAILFRDVIPRFDIRNPLGMEALARYLVSNPGKPFSYRNLSKVTSIKHEDTVKSYIGFLEKSYLFFTLPFFDYSIKKQAANLKKVYPADTSFTRFSGTLFSDEKGRLLETIVCNHNVSKGYNLFYWKDEKGREVDFVICEGLKPIRLVQVAETIDNSKVWKRETESLLSARAAFGGIDSIVLTNNITETPKVEGIAVKSVLDWILEN